MVADDLGNKDYIGIVISKKEIDFTQLNNAINASRQSSYHAKLRAAVASEQIPNINYKTVQTIAFDADTKGKNVVSMVIEIEKR